MSENVRANFVFLLSPETYEAFSRTPKNLVGVPKRRLKAAQEVSIGDYLFCYMSKLSRWAGILQIVSEYFIDDQPVFYPENDPFVVRFNTKPVIWLPKEHALPIGIDQIWNRLSFTKEYQRKSTAWTGRIRTSLGKLPSADAKLLVHELVRQEQVRKEYPIDEELYSRLVNLQRFDPDKPA